MILKSRSIRGERRKVLRGERRKVLKHWHLVSVLLNLPYSLPMLSQNKQELLSLGRILAKSNMCRLSWVECNEASFERHTVKHYPWQIILESWNISDEWRKVLKHWHQLSMLLNLPCTLLMISQNKQEWLTLGRILAKSNICRLNLVEKNEESFDRHTL